MEIQDGFPFLNVFLKSLTILATLIGGLWVWSKYIIERALIPPAEFSLDFNFLGTKEENSIVECLLLLKNIGNSTLVVKDIMIRIKYLGKNDNISIFTDKKEGAKFGRLNFPNSRSRDFSEGKKRFTVIGYDTFVQPGVRQIYTLVTTIPEDASFLLLKGEFKYAQKPSALQESVLWISRRLGLINWSLYHIQQPHTIERCFKVEENETA